MALRFALAILTILGVAAVRGLPSAAGPRARAKDVLKAHHCDGCHDSTVSTEKPRALAIYDLVEPDWPARMSDAQLPKLLGRLKSAPAADQKTVREFIGAELKARAADRR